MGRRVEATPRSNNFVRWTPVSEIPEYAKNLVPCEGLVPNIPWCKYFVHSNERKFALLESRHFWYLSVYTANEDGTKPAATYWAGEPLEGGGIFDLCKGANLQFDPQPIGGACASMRACERIINGVATCIPWDKPNITNYALKVLPIVAAGAGIGALARKKNRKRGALYGLLGGLAAVGVLYAANALRPKTICDGVE